jgi:uncharacterized protein involved in exopolysaccharide biosynthesis
MDKIEDIIRLIDSHEKRETRNFFLKYLKQWPWFLVLSLIGIVLGYLYYKNLPSNYEINSRILIKSENTSLSDLLSFDNPVNVRDNINLENKIGTLKSYTLFSEAVNNLNWETSWYKKELLYKKDLYKTNPFELVVPPNANNAKNIFLEISVLNEIQYQLKAKGESSSHPVNIDNVIKFGEPFTNDFFNFTLNKGKGVTNEVFYLMFNDLQVLTNSYLEKTEISREDLNSDIISIKIEGENVQKEADFINELNNVYINYGVSDKNKSSESSLQFIDSQIVRIQGALSIAQNNFSSYRRNNQAMDLGQEAQLVYTKLDEIENEKYLTELQINFYNELQNYLDDAKKIEQMINPSVIGITDENLNSMLTKLMDLYSRREVLTYSVQNSNPSMILIEKEIKLTRDALEETLKNQLRATESKMESMKERYTAIESRLKELPETEKQLIGIQRDST